MCLLQVRGDGGEGGGEERGVVEVHPQGAVLGAAGRATGGQREGDEERGQHERALVGRQAALPMGRRHAVRARPADAADRWPVRPARARRPRRGTAVERAVPAVAPGGRARRGHSLASPGSQWCVI